MFRGPKPRWPGARRSIKASFFVLVTFTAQGCSWKGARKLEKWVLQEAFVTTPNFLAKVVIPFLLIPSPQELHVIFSLGISHSTSLHNTSAKEHLITVTEFSHPTMQRAHSLEKTLTLGKTEGRRRRGRQDEMVRWMGWLNGCEFQQTPGDGEGQRSLPYCSPWSLKQLDTTEQLNNSKNPLGSYQQLFSHI